ncbi:MAG: PAS-domain containing protein, partial [Hyphomicrobiales bacterium]
KRRDDGRIAWANNAYVRAVDGEALEQVVGQTMTLTGEGQDSADEKPAKRRDDGRIAWANNAYVRAVDGEALEQVVGQTMTLTGEGHDSADEKPAKRRDDGQDGAGAKPAKRRDRAIIGGVRTALEITEVETPEGRAGFAVDISALEACEKDLERHIRAHSSTLDHLTTAIAIFGPDQRLRFHNAAYAQLWTLDSRWLSTRPGDGEILDRVREQRLLPEHADYRDWKTRWLDIYTALEPREDWWYLPDGRTVRVVGEPHPFGGVIYLYEDATALITLESRYNELIGVQRETLDHLSEGIALFGADGRLKLFNPAYGALWALDKSFLDGEPHIDDVIASSRAHLPDDGVWNKLKSAVTALDDARRPSRARITRPDGRILDFAHVPLPDGNTLITHGDVTDSARIERALRERAEALEEADRLKSQFLSSISYELRTPLTTIIGFSDSLILGLAGELAGKQREYIGDILAAAQDLLTIIDSILDLTTIDAGAMELLIESVDIAGLLHETTQAVRDHLDSRAIGLDIDIPEEIGLLKADKRRLAQILFHLLTNAIGYSRDRGVIRLGARRESGEVVIWVEDTGGGMEQDFVATAFERFHSRPAASGHRGPGLGLALVKSLIELHEGTVTLRSKPSKGTVVTCRFPADGPDHRRYDPRNAALPVSRHSAGEWTRPRSAAR